MPYLMHIALDKPFRLKRRVYYFAYSGVRFKFIQNNPRKWSDVLLTVVPTMNGPEVAAAFLAAGTFASALSWAWKAGICIRHVGGPGIGRSQTLRQAKCRVRVFPDLPWPGGASGFNIREVARIDNDEQKLALALYREAKSANKVILSILLYWQILEINQPSPIAWINNTYLKRKQHISLALEYISRLPLAGGRLGEYLQEDCRHAIAHIRRHHGRKRLLFDDEQENARLANTHYVLEALATHYITSVLQVNHYVVLRRYHGYGFPTYVDESTAATGWYSSVRH